MNVKILFGFSISSGGLVFTAVVVSCGGVKTNLNGLDKSIVP